MRKNNIKKQIIIACCGLIVSCSYVGVRTVPDSAVVSRDRVVENSILEIKNKFKKLLET